MAQRSRYAGEGIIHPSTRSSSSFRAGRALPNVQTASTKPVTRRGNRAKQRLWRAPPAARRRGRGASLRNFAVIATLAAGIVLGFRALHPVSPAGLLGSAQAAHGDSTPKLQVDPRFVAQYQSAVESYLTNRPGTYAVMSYDLATGAGVSVNPNNIVRAASVNKLDLLVDLYQRATTKQFDLDATTVIGPDDIQNYGTGTIQLGGPGQTYTYRQLARLMVQESDNTAAFVIGKRIGLDKVQADLQKWGLKQTSMTDNATTVADVTLLLTRLQRRELLPEAQTAELLNLLEHTVWTDRIQSGVPQGMLVAHKIGTDVNVYNDAAIVMNGDHPYIEVILSAGTDEAGALLSMTRISQTVYEFESGLPAATLGPGTPVR